MRTSLISIGKTFGQLLSLSQDTVVIAHSTIGRYDPESLDSGFLKLQYIQVKNIDFVKTRVRYNNVRCKSYAELAYYASPWTLKLITQKAEQMKFPIKKFVSAKEKIQKAPSMEQSQLVCANINEGISKKAEDVIESLRRLWTNIEKHSHYLQNYKGGRLRYELPKPKIDNNIRKTRPLPESKMNSEIQMLPRTREDEEKWNAEQDELTLAAIEKGRKLAQKQIAIEESQKRKPIRRMAHFVHASDCTSTASRPAPKGKFPTFSNKMSNNDRAELPLVGRGFLNPKVESKDNIGLRKSRDALMNMTVKQFDQFLRKVMPFSSDINETQFLIRHNLGHKIVHKTSCVDIVTDRLVQRYFTEYNWCI